MFELTFLGLRERLEPVVCFLARFAPLLVRAGNGGPRDRAVFGPVDDGNTASSHL